MTMLAVGIAIPLVKEFEGCSLSPYLCPAGVATIGWGATYLPDGSRVTMETPSITQAGADDMLAAHVAKVADDVDALLPDTVTDRQRAALYSFAFNLGIGALGTSTLLRKLTCGDVSGAAAEFDRWVKAGGRVLPGLVRRRAAERALFESGAIE